MSHWPDKSPKRSNTKREGSGLEKTQLLSTQGKLMKSLQQVRLTQLARNLSVSKKCKQNSKADREAATTRAERRLYERGIKVETCDPTCSYQPQCSTLGALIHVLGEEQGEATEGGRGERDKKKFLRDPPVPFLPSPLFFRPALVLGRVVA